MRGKLPWTAAGALAVGVVVGYLLGGVGPRAALQEREEEVAALTAELEAAGPREGWRSPVPGLDRILRAPPGDDDARGSERRDELPPAPPPPDVVAEGPSGPAPVPADAGPPRERPTWRDRWGRDGVGRRMQAFRRAAAIQRVRRVQSRAALAQQAGLDDAEMQEVDASLARMNRELAGYGEELLVLAMADRPPPARDLLGITHDVTGILHRAQLELEGVLGAERVGDVDPSALEIWNHVDLGQLEPAARAAAERGP